MTMKHALGFFACLTGLALADVVLKEQAYLRLPNRAGGYTINSGTARESAFDERYNYMYVVGREAGLLHIINLATPTNPAVVLTHVFDLDVDGRPLDVDVCRVSDTESLFAVSFDGTGVKTNEGHVVRYNLFTSDTDTLTSIGGADAAITVGAHPDNLKFTTDCKKIVVSNEGEPAVVSGVFMDPPGSVSIITINDPPQSPSVSTIDFTKYNSGQDLTDLLASGVRYWLRRDPLDNNKVINFSQNAEPEYVAISPSEGFAYVTMQENNAIARVDIINNAITNVYPMLFKDWSSIGFDPSDSDNAISAKPYRVRSMYQPDKIKFFDWGGKSYLLTTDEGKPTTIPGTTFKDYEMAKNIAWDVGTDTELGTQLNTDAELGRLQMSTIDGFENTVDEPTFFGGRGFSIWNALAMTREFHSTDDMEKQSRLAYPATFNGNCGNFNFAPGQERDLRSIWMGPEINTVGIGNFSGNTVIILGSGRNGLLYVYRLRPNIPTRPDPEFQSVHRAGDVDGTWNTLYQREDMGDAVIADIQFTTGTNPMVLVTSEASGSVSVYHMADEIWTPPTSPTMLNDDEAK